MMLPFEKRQHRIEFLLSLRERGILCGVFVRFVKSKHMSLSNLYNDAIFM